MSGGLEIETWQSLLRQAFEILDSASVTDWSLGGGTVLMLRYRHRLSKGIDIFVPDPQALGQVSAELRDRTHVAEPGALKLYAAEGEIDFIASRHVTARAVRKENFLGRAIWVETSAEIVAKKLWYRAARFSARDLVDFAVLAKREPRALLRLKPLLTARASTLLERLAGHEAALREDFAALDLLEFQASFEQCLQILRQALGASDRAEQPRADYCLIPA